MIHTPVTAGEALCVVIYERFVRGADWDGLRKSLGLTQRSRELTELFQEIVAVNLTCRLVSAGISLAHHHSVVDPYYEMELKRLLAEHLGIPKSFVGEVYRNVVPAVEAARHDFTPKERDTLRRWARENHPHCYLCGVGLDFARSSESHRKYTLEHLWPRHYGGDSIPQNALPACGSCNGVKTDLATWGMVAVQALLLGLEPAADIVSGIPKEFKYALHHRTARRFAHIEQCSMKDSFVRLGPWLATAELRDPDAFTDFFNLRNHRQDPRLDRLEDD